MGLKYKTALIWRCEIEAPLKNMHKTLFPIYFSSVVQLWHVSFVQ